MSIINQKIYLHPVGFCYFFFKRIGYVYEGYNQTPLSLSNNRTHSINRGYTMKYACLIASLCACFSCLMFPMGYKPRVPHRPSTTHAHKPQPSQHLDEELESAIEASLQEQALYNAARQQATMSFIHITQGDIPFDDALAMAMAASLETQQPELEPAMPRKKESAQPKHNSIKGDEACPICASTVEELGIDQARFTHCCHQFICKNDAQELEKRSSELYTNMQDAEWRKRYAESPDFTGWPYALQNIDMQNVLSADTTPLK